MSTPPDLVSIVIQTLLLSTQLLAALLVRTSHCDRGCITDCIRVGDRVRHTLAQLYKQSNEEFLDKLKPSKSDSITCCCARLCLVLLGDTSIGSARVDVSISHEKVMFGTHMYPEIGSYGPHTGAACTT